MKNILVLGCSWSRAYAKQYGDKHNFISWPELLSQHGYHVWNCSPYCHSLEAQNLTLWHYLNKWGKIIDAVIIQFTTSGRMTMLQDWNDYVKRLDNVFNDQFTRPYTQLDEELVITGGTWNGMGVCHLNPSTVPRRWRKCYEDSAVYRLGVVGQHDKYFGTILRQDMTRMVAEHNIPCIGYMHIYNHGVEKESHAYQDHLYFRDRSYTDFVLQWDLPGFEDYVIDNGYHFERAGNTAIVEQMILPRLEQLRG